jgi:hypothetical protein
MRWGREKMKRDEIYFKKLSGFFSVPLDADCRVRGAEVSDLRLPGVPSLFRATISGAFGEGPTFCPNGSTQLSWVPVK